MILSLIHYARWVIIGKNQFPHLDKSQPKEDLKYPYMLFFSNFNGSWDQYGDSFTFAIPGGFDMFWKWSIRYPKSVPLTPFHEYNQYNQSALCVMNAMMRICPPHRGYSSGNTS